MEFIACIAQVIICTELIMCCGLNGFLVLYNNNNNIVICKVRKVSGNTESEAPAVTRWQHW